MHNRVHNRVHNDAQHTAQGEQSTEYRSAASWPHRYLVPTLAPSTRYLTHTKHGTHLDLVLLA